MLSPDAAIAIVAARQFGVFTRAQALRAGLTHDSIRRRRESGLWIVLYRGVYALVGVPRVRERDAFAAVAAYGNTAVASSVTAAALVALMEPLTEVVHITLPPGQRRAARPGIVVHQSALRRSDVRTVRGIRVTAPNRTLVDLAATVSHHQLENALDTAVFRGLTSVSSLRRFIQERHLGHLRGGGTLRELLDDRTKGSPESELEREFLRSLRACGLPAPTRQFRVGRRRIDTSYPDHRLIIELDGRGSRYTRAGFQSDRHRQNEVLLTLPEWTLLRFTRDDLFDDWPYVETTLRTALAA